MLAGTSVGCGQEVTRLMKRLAMALLVTLFLPLPLLGFGSAPTAQQIIESRLTVTFTETVEGSGSTRTISHTVQVVDSQANLTEAQATGSQLRIYSFSLFQCSSYLPASIGPSGTQSGCQGVFAPLNASAVRSAQSFTLTRTPTVRILDSFLSSRPFVIPRLVIEDAAGNLHSFSTNWTRVPLVAEEIQGGPVQELSPLDAPVVRGQVLRAAAGDVVLLSGSNLQNVTSLHIGAEAVPIWAKDSQTLSFEVPNSVGEGTYDLVLRSSYGTLTLLKSLQVRGPTPDRSLTLRGLGRQFDAVHSRALNSFRASLIGGYQQIRCVANSKDMAVSKALAVRACAQLARGEFRNVEVVHDSRSTFGGSGFWLRIYATG